MRQLAFLFFLICGVFSVSLSWCHAQVKVDCCGVKMVIPKFNATSVESSKSGGFIRQHVLPSIDRSSAQLEIRVSHVRYQRPADADMLTIRCEGGKFIVTRYLMMPTIQKSLPDSQFHNLGPYRDDPSLNIFLFRENINVDPEKFDWNNFFKQLITNHFFDLCSGPTIQALVAKKYSGISLQRTGVINVDLKVKDHCRSFQFDGYYDTMQPDVKEYNYYRKVLQLIGQLQSL
ncbi:hypothetical protein HQ865_05830 [Mucilaginibacter mali]|uniref:Uncharacterized protein n=1 Tax=Mucilaginibacter mali TaxID=2740462 RepID=A0A7D4TL87_9SPHI|nr:hypothetical protein [Mucilaginibacter mali]QKJ29293.1 hypothetical protein HQ865_05830 [Mucilaginibacter mali]